MGIVPPALSYSAIRNRLVPSTLEEDSLNLNAPTQLMFIIAVVLALIALVGYFVPTIAIIGVYAFWIMTLAFIVLAAGVLFRGT